MGSSQPDLNNRSFEQQYQYEMDLLKQKRATLVDTNKRRKELERDAQLLANRIALLKQEEMKTWKKIEETKKKTGDILGLKRRNEDRVRKRFMDSQIH